MNNLEYSLDFTKGWLIYNCSLDNDGEGCQLLDYSSDDDVCIMSKKEDSEKIFKQFQTLLKENLPDLISKGEFNYSFFENYVYIHFDIQESDIEKGLHIKIILNVANKISIDKFKDKFKDLTNMTFDEFLSLKGLTVNSLKGTYKFLNNAIIGNTDKGIRKLKDLTPTFPDFDKKLFRVPLKMKVEYSPDMNNLELLKYLISSVRWESGQEKSLLTRYRLKRLLIMGSHNDFLPMYGFTVKDGEQFLNTVRCDCINDTISLTYILSSITSTDAIEHRTITIDTDVLDDLNPLLLEIFLNNLRYHYITYLTHADNGYWEYKKHAKVEETITGIWYYVNEKRVGKKEVDK